MHLSQILAAQAVLVASAHAQDVLAQVWVYSTEKCAGDSWSGSTDFTVFESNKVLSGGEWKCMYGTSKLSGFEDSGTQYTIFVDQTTIPDDCSLVLYQGPPKGEEVSQGECQTYYASISNSGGGCVKTQIQHDFGYALCCGSDCEAAAAPPPEADDSAKRDVKEAKDVAQPAPRDVAAMKRTNPLDRLSRREDCTFSGEGDSVTAFEPQIRLAGSVNCPGPESCDQTVQFTYSSSVTNTYGVSSEIGASLFDVISLGVSFSAEVSHETSKEFTWSVTVTVPAGQSGYVTFQPRTECTPKGKFSGGKCKGAPTDIEGHFCYQALVSGNPDGQVSFVQDI
ncbi:hypothetical protein EJ04DRAFT_580851 [Polyplosphaeria fusca]|uniref:Uncharacterized protein n=1 Tax=Polyplosphaeria fusca TaxID=682080 RepID=A0A9P4QMN4_9PLEO|nr:hypothetical protein EJ04DRAFT_580851 [Polyplosphaeria fusca]